jgi:hypothetical protein
VSTPSPTPSPGNEAAAGVAGGDRTFVGFGILTWRGPAPRWAGILLALTGVAAAVNFPAWYMLGALVFGLVGVVAFRRGWPRRPYPPAAEIAPMEE